jgi:hypothetical protein
MQTERIIHYCSAFSRMSLNVETCKDVVMTKPTQIPYLVPVGEREQICPTDVVWVDGEHL